MCIRDRSNAEDVTCAGSTAAVVDDVGRLGLWLRFLSVGVGRRNSGGGVSGGVAGVIAGVVAIVDGWIFKN